jgi:hypothetical protein
METIELDFARLDAAGIVTPKHGRTGVAEDIRLLKRALLNRVAVPDGRASP